MNEGSALRILDGLEWGLAVMDVMERDSQFLPTIVAN